MSEFFQLIDSKFQGNYTVKGNYRALLPFLNLRLEPRQKLDKIFLQIQYFFKKRKNDHAFESIFEKTSSAILFNTEWYKETKYIGIIENAGDMFFIKMAREANETSFYKDQSAFIEKYFSDFFSIAGLKQVAGNVLIYEYIHRSGKVIQVDQLITKIEKLNQSFLSKYRICKKITEILPDNLGIVFANDNSLTSCIETWARKGNRDIPVIPVHGDMTPWNMFVDMDGRIALVDYESAKWHVPYYDYFHFILQPVGLRSRYKSIKTLLPEIDYPLYKHCFVLYLIDQLYNDCIQANRKGFNKPLGNLIKNKRRWLMELLDG